VYNWLIDFFHNHSHSTVFKDQWSSLLNITASIVQGSVIGLAALTAATARNSLCKFADDTYLVIPASNEAFRQVELPNIRAWANRNNLRLNCSKSCEVIFSDSRRKGRSVREPVPLPGITRSRCLKVLGVGVRIASDFSVLQHIQRLVTATAT